MIRPRETAPKTGRRGLKILLRPADMDPLWAGVAICSTLLLLQMGLLLVPTRWGGGPRYSAYLAQVEQTRESIGRLNELAASDDPQSLEKILGYLDQRSGAVLGRAAGYGRDAPPLPWSYTSAIPADRGPVNLLPHIADALAEIDHPRTIEALIGLIAEDGGSTRSRQAVQVLALLGDPRAIAPLRARYLSYAEQIWTDREVFDSHRLRTRSDLALRPLIAKVLGVLDHEEAIRFFSDLFYEDVDLARKYLGILGLNAIDDSRTLPVVVDALLFTPTPPPATTPESHPLERLKAARWHEAAAAIRNLARSSVAFNKIDPPILVRLILESPAYHRTPEQLDLLLGWPCNPVIDELFAVLDSESPAAIRLAVIEGLIPMMESWRTGPLADDIRQRIRSYVTGSTVDGWDYWDIYRFFSQVAVFAADELLEELERRNPTTLRCAIEGLGKTGRRDVIGPLEELIDHPEPRIRSEVIHSLWRLDDHKAEKISLTRLAVEDCSVRNEITRDLLKYEVRRSVLLLVNALEDCPGSWVIDDSLGQLFDRERPGDRSVKTAEDWRSWISANPHMIPPEAFD